jgi:glycerophosphoryl diester phosphodiesterase
VAPLVIAHRGGASHLGENTAAAFRAGIASGADMLECDIRRSRDGVLVLIHDKEIMLPAGALARVARTDFRELQQALPGLLTFPEFIEEFGGRLDVNVDVKHLGHEREIVDHLRAFDLLPRVLVSSTSWRTLRRMKRLAPELRTGLSRGQFVSWVGQEWRSHYAAIGMRPLLALQLPVHARLAGASATMLQYRLATPRLVGWLNRLGLDVFVWTVDTEDEARRVRAAGVTGLATNRPERVIPALRGEQPG